MGSFVVSPAEDPTGIASASPNHARDMSREPIDLIHEWRALTQDTLATLGQNPDFVCRRLRIAATQRDFAVLAFFATIVDAQQVDQDVIAPLLRTEVPSDLWDQAVMARAPVQRLTTWPAVIRHVVQGWTILWVPGLTWTWGVDTTQYPSRSIGRP